MSITDLFRLESLLQDIKDERIKRCRIICKIVENDYENSMRAWKFAWENMSGSKFIVESMKIEREVVDDKKRIVMIIYIRDINEVTAESLLMKFNNKLNILMQLFEKGKS